MKHWAIAGMALLLAACAGAPSQVATPERSTVFNDALFKPPSQRISASDVFALSPEMLEYLRSDISRVVRTKGSQHGLFDALYDKGLLKLEYDAAMTRNASQAFAARAGNCLSLVIMRKLTLAEITLIGTYTYSTADLRATALALHEGAFGDLGWVEERPLAEGAAAFRDLHQGRCAAAKIVLRP